MTYSEVYMKATTPQELLDMVRYDVAVCRMYDGDNPDRMKAIYNAIDSAAKARGWNASAIKMRLKSEAII